MASFGSGFLQEGDFDMELVRQAIADRDQKISGLKADKVKLKQLLKKAKVALDSINSKHKSVCEQTRLLEVKL